MVAQGPPSPKLTSRIAARARELALEPLAPSRQRWFYAAVAALGAALWAYHARALGRPVFPVDDAYITLHNAVALRTGRDPNFAGVSPLHGATSAVHLALVALLCALMQPAWALYAAAWLGAIAYALGLARLAFVHRATAAQAALVVVAGVLVGRTPHQLMNGLETGLTLAGMVWTMSLASVAAHRRYAAVACGVLPFLRPELASFSAPVVALLAWRAAREAGGRREALRATAETLGLALAGAAPWLLWYRASTGSFWPTTIAAKRAFFSEGCLAADVKQRWVRDALAEFSRYVGLLTRALVLCALTPLGWAGLALAAAMAVAYYQNFPGALGHYENRYLYVLVPVMLYGAASCFPRKSALLRGGAAMLLLLSIEQSAWEARDRWRQHLNNRAFTAVELDGVAAFCREHLPANARLLIHDAGYISAHTSFAMVDIVGLKTPASAAIHQRVTFPTCGARRGDAVHQIAMARRPDHLVVLHGWNDIFGITEALRAHGWTLTSLRPPGVAYDVYRLTPPP